MNREVHNNQEAFIPGHKEIKNFESIICFIGRRNYTDVYVEDMQDPLYIGQTLKWFEEKFPSFVRVRKSCLINPKHIKSISSDKSIHSRSITFLLNNGLQVSSSRRNFKLAKSINIKLQ